MTRNALTIDVEEFFHAENLRRAYPPETWPRIPSRLDEPMGRLMGMLERHQVRATFFVLGWVAERRPWIVERLARAGHEIASHGYGHEPLTRSSPEAFREDLRHANRVLSLLTQGKPRGYRAPCFTITPKTRWALRVLAEEGFEYDSSIFPIAHDRYGDPDAPTGFHHLELEGGLSIAEAPPATVRALGRNWPIAGGGYLRLFPLGLCASGIASLNAKDLPAVVYLHPWELDADQPAHPGVPFLKRVRHAVGTRGLEDKLDRLLTRFPFGTLESVLEERGLLKPIAPPVARPFSSPASEAASTGTA